MNCNASTHQHTNSICVACMSASACSADTHTCPRASAVASVPRASADTRTRSTGLTHILAGRGSARTHGGGTRRLGMGCCTSGIMCAGVCVYDFPRRTPTGEFESFCFVYCVRKPGVFGVVRDSGFSAKGSRFRVREASSIKGLAIFAQASHCPPPPRATRPCATVPPASMEVHYSHRLCLRLCLLPERTIARL